MRWDKGDTPIVAQGPSVIIPLPVLPPARIHAAPPPPPTRELRYFVLTGQVLKQYKSAKDLAYSPQDETNIMVRWEGTCDSRLGAHPLYLNLSCCAGCRVAEGCRASFARMHMTAHPLLRQGCVVVWEGLLQDGLHTHVVISSKPAVHLPPDYRAAPSSGRGCAEARTGPSQWLTQAATPCCGLVRCPSLLP